MADKRVYIFQNSEGWQIYFEHGTVALVLLYPKDSDTPGDAAKPAQMAHAPPASTETSSTGVELSVTGAAAQGSGNSSDHKCSAPVPTGVDSAARLLYGDDSNDGGRPEPAPRVGNAAVQPSNPLPKRNARRTSRREVVVDAQHYSARTVRRTRTMKRMSSEVLRDRVDLVSQTQGATLAVSSQQNGSSLNRASNLSMDGTMGNHGAPKCCCRVPMINPLSLGHSLWDLFIAFVLAVSLITLPVGMAFDTVGDDLFLTNVMIDALFIADIIITFCTGFIDGNDELVMDPTKVARQYLFTWFALDAIASVPLDAILRVIEENQLNQVEGGDLANLTKTFKLMRLVRMIKLVRLFRLSRVSKYFRSLRLWFEHHTKCSIPQAFIKIGKLFVLLVLVGHWLGCILIILPKQFSFPYNSWIVQSGLRDLSISEQYSWALMKALYMMIGGEEMLPSGNGLSCEDLGEYCAAETWVSLVALYLGAIFSALLISEVGLIVTNMDRSRQLYHEKLEQVNEYMRANKLSPELREHVREYFSLRFSDHKMFHEKEIMSDLSPNLMTKIREEVSSSIVARVPLLRDNEVKHAFIDIIVTRMSGPLICFQKEIIFYEGTTGHAMYFIYSGVVGIFSSAARGVEDGPEGAIVAALGNGCYFGEVAMLLGCRRTATARSETISVLHTLDEETFNDCLEDAPDVKKYMIEVAKKRQQRVAQIDPNYTGIVDTRLESSSYVDPEDAKTDLFRFETTARPREDTGPGGGGSVLSGGNGGGAQSGGGSSGGRKTVPPRKRRASKMFDFDKSAAREMNQARELDKLLKASTVSVKSSSTKRRASFTQAARKTSPSSEARRESFLEALAKHPEILADKLNDDAHAVEEKKEDPDAMSQLLSQRSGEPEADRGSERSNINDVPSKVE